MSGVWCVNWRGHASSRGGEWHQEEYLVNWREGRVVEHSIASSPVNDSECHSIDLFVHTLEFVNQKRM